MKRIYIALIIAGLAFVGAIAFAQAQYTRAQAVDILYDDFREHPNKRRLVSYIVSRLETTSQGRSILLDIHNFVEADIRAAKYQTPEILAGVQSGYLTPNATATAILERDISGLVWNVTELQEPLGGE